MSRGWFQADVVKRLAAAGHTVTASAVSRWESGTYAPSPRLLPAIASVFEVDVADLFTAPVKVAA